MEQFTAIEVRDHARELQTQDEPQIEAAHMLTTFADLLEAQEKAVPFGYAYRYWDCIRFDTGGREINGSKPTATIPLYTHTPTHPASADAERLAEALRELVVACEEHDAMVSRIIGHPAGWNAQYLNSARQALAAHPAQAQPPVASVTVDAVMRVIDGQRRLPYCSIDEKQAFRNELESALAAQENPNG